MSTFKLTGRLSRTRRKMRGIRGRPRVTSAPMTVIVRDLRPDVRADAEGFSAVRREALPYMLSTPESVLHTLTHAHPGAHFGQLIAEEDGEVVGTAQICVAHDSPE